MIMLENTDVYGLETAIRGYPEYKVTKDGQVIGKRGKTMKGCIDKCGYRAVVLSYYPNLQKQERVHRLVLSTFNPIENMGDYDVNHKNGDKLDNRLENLEWCTRSENIKHSYKNGLQAKVTNLHGTYCVLTETDLNTIKLLHCNHQWSDLKIAKHIGCSRSLVSRKIREMNIR